MPPISAENYDKYIGQRVEIVVGDADNQEPDENVTGTVLPSSNKLALAIKMPGRAGFEIVRLDQIVDIEIVDQPEKSLKTKYLKPVPPHLLRQHLFEAHGILRADLERMELEHLISYHKETHEEHGNGQLGHAHGDKPSTKREKAIAEAEESKA